MPMDVVEIQRILPHRYPFLMIDRVTEVERMKRIVAIKNVTVNELEVPDRESKLVVFTGIDNAKFRRPVVPGDTVRFEVTVANWRSRAGKMEGVAYVGDKRACEATLSCMLVPKRNEDKVEE